MSPLIAGASLAAARFPRVSGDEPVGVQILTGLIEFSPRERG